MELEWGREKPGAGVWKSDMKLEQIQGFQKILREMTGGGLGSVVEEGHHALAGLQYSMYYPVPTCHYKQ